MLKYFDNTLDKNIYKIDLLSISEESTIYIDLPRKENIFNMTETKVKEIFIQKTASNNYVKEILTGMLIPVKREVRRISEVYFAEVDISCVIDNLYDSYNKNNSLTYVKIAKDIEKNNYYSYYNFSWLPLINVKGRELTNYLEKHKDINMWKLELENIFEDGERKYQEALSKKQFSDNRKANSNLIKKLKKKKFNRF